MVNNGYLISVFNDTMNIYTSNKKLQNSISSTIKRAKFYEEEEYPDIQERYSTTDVSIIRGRTLETARKLRETYPDKTVAVLNFASGVNPGGYVLKGSSAQEEALCRLSTLYPCLIADNCKKYYQLHRMSLDPRSTDSILYLKDITVFKADNSTHALLEEKDWYNVDVITCAAPSLNRIKMSDQELYGYHVKRGVHILTVAAHEKVDFLVLGAFGCGAYKNNPTIVAKAYKSILPMFKGYFEEIVFAIYDAKWSNNLEKFKEVLK